MKKEKFEYICNGCGYTSSKWLGKCPSCQQWNTFVESLCESKVNSVNNEKSLTSKTKANLISQIKPSTYDRLSTGINELDRVLGGGIVKDSVIILTAEPGTGKSTILMQVCGNIADKGDKVLYVSGEENEGQIKSRADRINVFDKKNNLYLYSETVVENIINQIDEIKPSFVVIDSINTMHSIKYPDNPAGKEVQMKEVCFRLLSKAKTEGFAVCFIGQQTKKNELAGAREIEHAIDTVLYFESDNVSSLRVMRPSKNRFGNTDEIGLFEMKEHGLESIDNPSEIFITKRDKPIAGVALTVSLEGNRPLVVEIESLVRTTFYPNPSVISEYVKRDKLNTLLAIANIRGGIKVEGKDLFLQVTGGLKISEPSTSLGILMSIISASINEPINQKSVFMGEVSLAGDIKKVNNIERRLKELDHLGFEYAYIPKNNYKNSLDLKKLKVIEVSHIKELINIVFNEKNSFKGGLSKNK